MPNFAFQARDRGGQRVSGTREADNQHAALEALREAGFFVTNITPTRGGSAPRTNPTSEMATQSTLNVEATPVVPISQLPRIQPQPVVAVPALASTEFPQNGSPQPAGSQNQAAQAAPNAEAVPKTDWTSRADSKQMALFFRQMHGMLHAGTSLAQALMVIAQHDASPALRGGAYEMHLQTSRGTPWSQTMRAYPGLFSELMIGMVQAGETGGFLDRVCLQLSEYGERDYHLQQTIKRETWYPKLLVLCAILIPSVVPLFLQGFGAWLRHVTVPLLLVGGAWATWRAVHYFAPLTDHAENWRRRIDHLKLLVPVGGKAVRQLATAKFARALGTTYAAGMAPHASIRIASNACGNFAIQQSTLNVIPRVERGERMTDALASTGHFPPIVLQMLRTGEESGKIDEQLQNVADYLETDAETTIKQSVKVLGIAVFLLIALYIGSMIISSWTGYMNDVTANFE